MIYVSLRDQKDVLEHIKEKNPSKTNGSSVTSSWYSKRIQISDEFVISYHLWWLIAEHVLNEDRKWSSLWHLRDHRWCKKLATLFNLIVSKCMLVRSKTIYLSDSDIWNSEFYRFSRISIRTIYKYFWVNMR